MIAAVNPASIWGTTPACDPCAAIKPLLDLTLFLLGLPLIVSRNNRNKFVAAAMCLGLVVVFFLTVLTCQTLAPPTCSRPSSANGRRS